LNPISINIKANLTDKIPVGPLDEVVDLLAAVVVVSQTVAVVVLEASKASVVVGAGAIAEEHLSVTTIKGWTPR
jgi:hypothetical protein